MGASDGGGVFEPGKARSTGSEPNEAALALRACLIYDAGINKFQRNAALRFMFLATGPDTEHRALPEQRELQTQRSHHC